MNVKIAIAVGVLVLVVALVVVGPGLATSYARNKQLSECERLKAQLAALRVQGGDVTEAARLEQQIAACAQAAEAYGADIDLGSIRLGTCDAMYEQIEREFTHYRSTSYDDPVKRNNTRQTILRVGEELARCYQEAISQAESVATLDTIRRSILRSLASATARRDCYLYDQTGCGRFALNEDHGNDKARAEDERVIAPLNAALAALDTRRASMASAARLRPQAAGSALAGMLA